MITVIELAHGISNKDLGKAFAQIQEQGTRFDFVTYAFVRTKFEVTQEDALAFAGQLKVGWSKSDDEVDANLLECAFVESDKTLMHRNVTNALYRFREVFPHPKFSDDCHAQLINDYLKNREYYSHSTAVRKTIDVHRPK